jgi:hypothetical protein
VQGVEEVFVMSKLRKCRVCGKWVMVMNINASTLGCYDEPGVKHKHFKLPSGTKPELLKEDWYECVNWVGKKQAKQP